MALAPSAAQDIIMEDSKHTSNEQNIHTPPASDMSSHGRKDEDDDAASSSELSDLDDQFERGPQPSFLQDVPMQDTAVVVEPDRYEDGIPIFQPTMEQFEDFEKYMNGVNPYGMKSGIVLIDPPKEWKAARKQLDDMVKTIKVRNPITQEFHHNEYGIYTQRNMEKMRTYNLPQWKALCEQSQYQPPARRGERRNKAGAAAGAKIVPLKRKSEPLPLPEGVRRKAGRPRVKPLKAEKEVDDSSSLLAPPTPTSPETKPVEPHKSEETKMCDITPTKRRGRPPKGGGQPKARQQARGITKKVVERTAADKATTVAARRLHNEADAVAEVVDEEDFANFDYRTHNHDDWTKERCEELEEKYWKSLSYTNPMYGADMPGSLFDDDTKCWNVARLPNLLDILGSKIPGVNTAYLYLGMWRATFAWHLEDVDLYSINYIHFGAPKQWYSISQADAPKFEKAMRAIYSHEAKNCDQFLRHKTFLVSPSLLKNKYGVTVNKVVHREGQFVVTFPIGYHSGYNLGYNCAESVNFALESWLPYGKSAKKCHCEDDSVFIDVDWFVRKLNGEPSPELEEWVEVTDDEDDLNAPTDLPTPPGSDRGQMKPAKRKRLSQKDGGGKKMKRIKIKILKSAIPCCLCPNDFGCDELLPTDDNRKAHRRCALYTPETYIDEVDGKDVIRGMTEISKARLDLRCNECRQKRGSCFQCSSSKCARAYHATCAAQAGVQVDIGDIAIWHEGVEYRDTGLDFRCKMHRSVKTAKPSSDLARDNHRHKEKDTEEFNAYLAGLKLNDIVQYQSSSADDIDAGVLVEPLNEDGILVVDVLPTHQRRYIEAKMVLFVDAATSCLQKPSANAKELPKHLRGQALSLEDSTNRKPSRLDHFCDGPIETKPYLWEEFASATPAFNKDQKQVELSKDGRLWHYIGQSSTESKAHYTGDPMNPVNDPAANFLQTVEPAKRPLSTHLQSSRRPSLPVVNPRQQHSGGANVPGTNAATVPAKPTEAQLLEQQKIGDYQRRMTTLASPALPVSPVRFYNRSPVANQSTVYAFSDQASNQIPQALIDPATREAMLAKRAAILERSQQRAMVLDQQDRPYDHPFKSSKPPSSIGIDTQSVERQREFQRQAYQQSLASTQLSPHSPSTHPDSTTYEQMSQWGQYAGPEGGIDYTAQHSSPNTAQYGPASPSPTETVFPLLRRPQQPLFSSSPSETQHNNYELHIASISSLPQSAQVKFSHDQPHLSLPTCPQSQPSQPSSSSPPPHIFDVSSTDSTAPIKISEPQRNMSNVSASLRNHGQHTANFIDPNLVQLNPNHQTAATPMTEAGQKRAEQASRSMPPPPLPSQSLHAVTNAGADHAKYVEHNRQDTTYTPGQEAEFDKKVVHFDGKLTDIIAEMKKKEHQKLLINDKPVPPSIVHHRHLSDTQKSRPNVYATPYADGFTPNGGPVVVTDREVTTKYGRGLVSKIVEGDGGSHVDGDDWVDVKVSRKGSGTAGMNSDSDWVHVEIERKPKGLDCRMDAAEPGGCDPASTPVRAHCRHMPTAGGGPGGLADRYYASRSAEEKKLIDEEKMKKKNIDWSVEAEK